MRARFIGQGATMSCAVRSPYNSPVPPKPHTRSLSRPTRATSHPATLPPTPPPSIGFALVGPGACNPDPPHPTTRLATHAATQLPPPPAAPSPTCSPLHSAHFHLVWAGTSNPSHTCTPLPHLHHDCELAGGVHHTAGLLVRRLRCQGLELVPVKQYACFMGHCRCTVMRPPHPHPHQHQAGMDIGAWVRGCLRQAISKHAARVHAHRCGAMPGRGPGACVWTRPHSDAPASTHDLCALPSMVASGPTWS